MLSSQKAVRGFYGGISAAIAIFISLSVLGTQAFAAGFASPSCGRSVLLRDYLAPFAKMPGIHSVPASGKLPFGPAGLTLRSEGQLVIGRGHAGFRFSDEAIGQQRNLQWRVVASLSRVGSTGSATPAPQATISRRLGVVDGNDIQDFLFDLPSSPAYYRVDLTISAIRGGQLLGKFSEYVRVMRPRVDLRVQVDEPNAVTRGGTVHARIKNLGTVALESPSYVFGFKVRRFDGARWVAVAENPPRGRVPKRMQVLLPGLENRGCLRYRVPEDAPLGRYRFQAGDLVAGFDVVAEPAL